MENMTRRKLLHTGSTLIRLSVGVGVMLPLARVSPGIAQEQRPQQEQERSIEEWMNEWMERRALVGPLHVGRFVESVYFLTQKIGWKPNSAQEKDYPAVEVPKGFVTDFASIPRIFWSLLRPDGEYTYPAIVHDYLYWTQTLSKDTSDMILKLGMEDLRVGTVTKEAIYRAVSLFGGSAWTKNAALKKEGEKRILRLTPDDPTTRWNDWKKLDVF